MKLIDADALITWFNDNYDDEDVSVGYVLGIIEEKPEAVIRCKDCKYCKSYDDIPWCNRLTGTFRVEDGSFCSFGKRRTNDD